MSQISIFDMLKIGVGPSSSHTMGPWKAAQYFLHKLKNDGKFESVDYLEVDLFGSLALTGKGHGTDMAVIMGLSGFKPEETSKEAITKTMHIAENESRLILNGSKRISFAPSENIHYHFKESLDFHPNGIRFNAVGKSQNLASETYFSVGGGFVVREGEQIIDLDHQLPFPIEAASDIQKHCETTGLDIAGLVFENEKTWRSFESVNEGILCIWDTMLEALFRGCHSEGVLPGGLEVKRRAPGLYGNLVVNGDYKTSDEWLNFLKNSPCTFEKTLKFVSCFAIATNEENADFGRVITAPTNGASGVIPAVLMYYICFSSKKDVTDADIVDFLAVAGEIGSVFKKGATISAAQGGCQAEIGVSSAMAAAALTHGFGGSVEQCLMAAEIAMEHHLGLTCDPVKGLVQIPCIERNSMGAVKAITASQIAMESNPESAKVSLDDVIRTMWQTAKDMNTKYKETSLGGLATNIAVSLPEC